MSTHDSIYTDNTSTTNSQSQATLDDVEDPFVSSTDSTVHIYHETNRNIRTRVRRTLLTDRAPLITARNNNISKSKALVLVAIIIVYSLLALKMFKLFRRVNMKNSTCTYHEDAKQLILVLDRYKENLQTFAIPGSIFLSILSGFLFPFYLALALVCGCSAIGASMCFFLSKYVLGKQVVKKFFPDPAAHWSVEKGSDTLLIYIIFLRVTSFLPNWFINMSAPVIGVPLVPFALGKFIGVALPSLVAIQAGQTLHTLTSTRDAFIVLLYILVDW